MEEMIHPDENEEWRPVVGFEEHYHISRSGLVKRVSRACAARPGRILKRFITEKRGKDYYFHILSVKGKIKSIRLHRMMVEAFIGPIPKGMQVNHKNGIKIDNSLENLEIVTPQENVLHTFRVLGRKPVGFPGPKGEKSARARLTNEKAAEIRSLCESGAMTHKELASKFGVSVSTIGRVVYKISYLE